VPSNRFHAYTPADRDVKLQCAGRFRARRKSQLGCGAQGPSLRQSVFSVKIRHAAAITRPNDPFRLKRKLTKADA
jgi:hypothetical protein